MFSRASRLVRAHPILLLAFLSPGIPEYLSGSTSWAVLLINPVLFILFVLLNVGLYTNGVILIREAVLRWKKGWASIFLLGVAYGIVEEGLSLETLFNPNAGPVGPLGYYGHWLGVSWVWTVGLLLFHSTISIGLPILLFGLALPDLKMKSLLSLGRQKVCLALMLVDCLVLFFIVQYFPGWPIMIGSFLTVLALVSMARKVPASLGRPLAPSSISTTRLIILGLSFFPAVILTGAVSAGTGIPPLVPVGLDLVFGCILARTLRRSVRHGENDREKIAVAWGLVLPIILFGFIATTGVTLAADTVFLFFMRHIWNRHRTRKTSAPSLAPGMVLPTVVSGQS